MPHQKPEELLRELYAVPPRTSKVDGWPDAPIPDMFLPEPEQLGLAPHAAKASFELFNKFPQLRQKVSKVTSAPKTDFLIDLFNMVGVDPQIHADAGYWPDAVRGFWDEKNKTIAINPRDTPGDYGIGVLGHEAAHAVGRKHGDGPEAAGTALQDLMMRKAIAARSKK